MTNYIIYIIIAVAVSLVVVGTYLFIKKRKKKAKSKPQESQPVNEEKKEESGDLYLNEIKDGELTLNESDFKFNDDEADLDFESSGGGAFSGFSLDDELSKYEDDMGSFDFDFDDDFDDEEVERSEIVEEIHKMSPKMKALILTGVLDKKYF